MITLKQVAEQAQQKTEPLSLEKLVEFIGELLPSESAAVWDLVEQRYPKISLEFLSSRTPDWFPRFVPFHPDVSRFTLRGQAPKVPWASDWDNGMMLYGRVADDVRTWSNRLRHWFRDVVERLEDGSAEYRRSRSWFDRIGLEVQTSITQRFQGLVPSDVRRELQSVRKAISVGAPFIVAEAGPWELNEEVVTKQDPLVVLIPKVTHPQHGYLVAAFDVTQAEEYIKREFCE